MVQTVSLFYCDGDPRELHSFPTRRSSDLIEDDGISVAASVKSTTVGTLVLDESIADGYTHVFAPDPHWDRDTTWLGPFTAGIPANNIINTKSTAAGFADGLFNVPVVHAGV